MCGLFVCSVWTEPPTSPDHVVTPPIGTDIESKVALDSLSVAD